MPLISDLKVAYRFNRSLIGKGAKIGKDRKALSVKPYLEIEDSRNDQVIYLPQPVIQRRFWYKAGDMPNFPYNLIRGTSYWHHFLPDGMILEAKKRYGLGDIDYCLMDINSGERQEIKEWVYIKLYYIDSTYLEWNNFFVIDGDIIFELRAYTGKEAGNTIINFIFRNQDEAEKFTLPEWARSYIQEITDNRYFKDAELAASGFPRS